MIFYDQFFLFLLILIPVIAFLMMLYLKKRIHHCESLLNSKLLKSIGFDQALFKAQYFRIGAICLSLLFLYIALARPQWGEEKGFSNKPALNIIFVVDVSKSMLANDVKPTRFAKTKYKINQMLRKFKGNNIGLVAFSGQPFMICPLTSDANALKLFLNSLNVGELPQPGTGLSKAIGMALNVYKEPNDGNIIIIFSDGEDHQGGEKEIIRQVKANKVSVYSIGVGTQKGATISVDIKGSREKELLNDSNGKVVITKLNSLFLKKVADSSGGVYMALSDTLDDVNLIYKHIRQHNKQSAKQAIKPRKKDQFQLFVLVGMFLLICELFIIRKESK